MATEAQVRAFGEKNHSVDSFDTSGAKVCSYHVTGGTLSDKDIYKYQYNAHGKITNECVLYDSLSRCTTYTYDTSGKLIEEVTNFPWGDPKIIKFTYNNGHLATKYETNFELTIYAYNDKGQLIKDTTQHIDGATRITDYTYGDSGNIQSETCVYSSGDSKTVYTYDEHNNEVLVEEYSKDGIVLRRSASQYVYDKQGNWIVCIEETSRFDRDYTTQTLFVRDIEYY